MGNISSCVSKNKREIEKDVNDIAKVLTVVCPGCRAIIPSVVTVTDGVINIIANHDPNEHKD